MADIVEVQHDTGLHFKHAILFSLLAFVSWIKVLESAFTALAAGPLAMLRQISKILFVVLMIQWNANLNADSVEAMSEDSQTDSDGYFSDVGSEVEFHATMSKPSTSVASAVPPSPDTSTELCKVDVDADCKFFGRYALCMDQTIWIGQWIACQIKRAEGLRSPLVKLMDVMEDFPEYYAVAEGWAKGLYQSWGDCREAILYYGPTP